MRKALYILGQLSDQDMEWLVAKGNKLKIPFGSSLITENENIKAVYIVLDGLFSVSAKSIGEIAQLGSGEIIGEMSFVDTRPPSASVTAAEESVVLSIPQLELAEKLKNDLGFSVRFYRAIAIFLSYRLRDTVSQMGYGATTSVDEEAFDPDELDENMLDNAHMAGARFDRILRKVMDRD